MDFSYLRRETAEGVCTLTIDRPEALNALNAAVLVELEGALAVLDRDGEVKVIVLTGGGEKAFVAGADIREMAEMTSWQAHAFALRGQRVLTAMKEMRKPIVAAVNGYALGGGLELALGCDFIYASRKAKLGFPEVTLGIMPGFGGTQNLARLVGKNRASELIFTGRIIDAEKGREWGLVNEVFPAEELLPRARETAAAIARVGTLGVAGAKDAITNGLNMSREDGLRYEAALFAVLFATEDQKEGMAAFTEKRKALFRGR